MVSFHIPGLRNFRLKYLVLDVNGTLATDGILIEGVVERLSALQNNLEIHLLTADTHGRQKYIDAELGLKASRIHGRNEAEQKEKYLEALGSEQAVAIGNGANDRLMVARAAIGIAVVGREGASVETLQNANIVCKDINDALDLLLHTKRLVASLRR